MGRVGLILDGLESLPNLLDTGVSTPLLTELTKRYGTSWNPIYIYVDYDPKEYLLTLITMEIHLGYIETLEIQSIGL